MDGGEAVVGGGDVGIVNVGVLESLYGGADVAQ